MSRSTNKSIRVQLLSWLLIPLLSLWGLCAAIAYSLAVGFANDAYDRELVNSADSVVARLKIKDGKVSVDLPPAAQAILHYNKQGKFYYQVTRHDGTRIFGDAMLPLPVKNLEAEGPILKYAKLNGQDVRMARVRVEIPDTDRVVLVQVAETLDARHKLAQEILLAILIPQAALICLGAVAIWFGISKSLVPLNNLSAMLAQRAQFDLTDVPEDDAPSEVKPLVKAINDLLSRLKSDIESQKRFVANSAHQIRTPLAALKTYIYHAKRLPSNQEMNSVLDKIDLSTQRMSHLSNKLLALARAEPANQFDDYKTVDLNDIASASTANFIAEATKKNLDMTFIGLDSPALVKGDPDNLSELTANLIENAVLYTNPGGKVFVRVNNGSDTITLSIEDDGPGIPHEERQHVFERFYRVLGTGAPGSGLGLPIVKEIASAHAANVQISDGIGGKGTTISVIFPQDKHSHAQ